MHQLDEGGQLPLDFIGDRGSIVDRNHLVDCDPPAVAEFPLGEVDVQPEPNAGFRRQ